ncbi:MAG: MarR family winged helix-turn-helix transcriptional regulator [Candidatus Gracilibacteria bacterium]
METATPALKFFLNLSKVQAIVSRRFDGGLGGLGLNEFIILFYLNQAPDEKMRRIDLAEKIGLTASGVTRMLVPMEKVGLVNREMTEHDARVRYVTLAPGGRRRLTEAMERAELLSQELIPTTKLKKIKGISTLMAELVGTIRG